LQFKYRDFFAGKISERSKINGQKLAGSTVKLPKLREPVKVLTRGRSCDYRVYGSDTPLSSLKNYGFLYDAIFFFTCTHAHKSLSNKMYLLRKIAELEILLMCSSVHNSTLHIFNVERYVGWGCY